MLHLLVLTALASLAPAGGDSPALRITDLDFGTTAPAAAPTPTDHLGLVPGHALVFRVEGGPRDAGHAALLFASPSELATPILIGTSTLYLDPAAAFLVAQSFLDPAGVVEWQFAVPGDAQIGAPLFTQAALVNLATGTIQTTNALDHVVTDASATVLGQTSHSVHPLSFVGGGTLLVESEAQWQAEWASTWILPGTAPAVDFTHDVVVMHFSAMYATSGHSVVVEGAAPLGPGALVHATLTTPDPSCPVTFGSTTPACIAILDRVAAGAPFLAQQAEVTSPPCP